MKEKKLAIAGVDFTGEPLESTKSPYVIGIFGAEHVGKTRFALTGPEVVGCVPLEIKSYITLDKDSQELGKRIYKPSDPMSLIPGQRMLAVKSDIEKQKFYIEHCKKIEETVYGLLENDAVRIGMMDKFTTYCQYKEYAINGMVDKAIPSPTGGFFKPRGEVVQSIIDFVNSLSQFKKPVVLLCAEKDDYEVLGSDNKPIRKTWDCGVYKHLGSHCNITARMETNERWKEGSTDSKRSWKYRMSIRRCQKNPRLEGPEGNPLLHDDEITFANLILAVDPDVDVEGLL